MTGTYVLLGAFAFIFLLLVVVAPLLDRLRGIDPKDKWAGWYQSKSRRRTGPLPTNQQYDSMNDHGNRDQDGGL